MNVNIASASMAQQYTNNLQTTSQPAQNVQQEVKPAVPDEPSKEARPIAQASDSTVGTKVDLYA